MIKNYRNKMVDESRNKGPGPDEEEYEYHFSGSTEYIPQTVKARTLEEAHREWERTRRRVGG